MPAAAAARQSGFRALTNGVGVVGSAGMVTALGEGRMKGLLLTLVTLAVLAFATLAFGYTAGTASAHRHGCHSAHTCPSDHATYRWSGRAGGRYGRWLCVKPTSPKRNSTFRIRVRYGGLTYWCKR